MKVILKSLLLLSLLIQFANPISVSAEPLLQKAPVSARFQQYLNDLKLPKTPAKLLASAKSVIPKTTGYIPSPNDYSHLKGKSSEVKIPAPKFQRAFAPLQYDLRSQGRVTPVRDQGQCGACWSFGSLASVESILLPQQTWDFSENNLKNRSGFDWPSCSGGNPDMAIAYLSRWDGPVSEADDPYSEVSSISPSDSIVKKHIQEVLILPPRGSALDNDAIKQALMDYGAVTTSIYVDGGATSSSLSAYYNPTISSYYYNGSSYSNHIVAIVGWDDGYSSSNFATPPPGNGAFIVKNSWGTSWGNNGYFYISYYDSVIGGDNYVFKSATEPNLYTKVYQYDSLGITSSTGYGQTDAWFANIFTSTGTENLSAVAFHTNDINVNYQVSIYKNVSPNAPTSGEMSATFSGTIPYPGYHTVALPTPVQIASGERFSVVIKLTNSTNLYPISLEEPQYGYSSSATANAGESFMSWDGTYWDDLNTNYANTNVPLKAFTSPISWTIDALSDGYGMVSCVSPVANNTASSCTVTPSNGYKLATFTDNGVDMKGSVTGGSYSIANVTANHTISATFSSISTSISWYHRPDGKQYGMTTDGSSVTGGGMFYEEANTAWGVVGEGDFDGDGIRDLVWWNSATGQVYIMLMANATATKAGGAVIYSEPDVNWKIVATGDLDGDGKTDLLWWNQQSGQVYAMLINGAAIYGGAIIHTEPDTDWKIVATGDFGGDGKSDLLWWNQRTGQLYLMSMDGQFVVGGAMIYTEPDTNWRIAGVGDLDGDGKADIVWHNRSTGQVYGMQTDGSSVTGGNMMYTEPNTNWKIVSIRNYNGDNKADLLWWNQQSGQVYAMPMNGLTVLEGSLLYTEPDTEWRIQGETEWRDRAYGVGVTTTTK